MGRSPSMRCNKCRSRVFWRRRPEGQRRLLDFSRARLRRMIDMHCVMAVPTARMRWVRIEASLAPLFAYRRRAARTVIDAEEW